MTYQVTLTEQEFKFLFYLIGNSSNSNLKNYMDKLPDKHREKEEILNLIDNHDISWKVYEKLEQIKPKPKVKKYKVLYKSIDGEYGISAAYYKDKEDFLRCNSKDFIQFIDLIKESEVYV